MQPEPTRPRSAADGSRPQANTPARVQRNYSLPTAVQTSAPASPDLLLDRLERVRRTGAGWTARCPAHEDRTASLSIGIGDDGRVLAHCFAGCSIHDVLGAVGLTVGDLFPRRLDDASPEARRQLRDHVRLGAARAAAGVLDHEAVVLLIAAGELAAGRVLADQDHDRVALAADRIHQVRLALEVCR